MARIYLVRHGRAAAGFGECRDPGLDDVGRGQADEVGRRLGEFAPLSMLSSPLLRARQTAVPLAKIWAREPQIEPAVAEIPSSGATLQRRAEWLREFMSGSWRSSPPGLAKWRDTVISTLFAVERDSVVFSHYIAINVVVGAALDNDAVVVFSPDNCSVTVVEATQRHLVLIEKGSEASPIRIN